MGMSFSLFPLFLAFGDFSILGQLMCLPLLINPRYQLAQLLITFLTSLAFIACFVTFAVVVFPSNCCLAVCLAVSSLPIKQF